MRRFIGLIAAIVLLGANPQSYPWSSATPDRVENLVNVSNGDWFRLVNSNTTWPNITASSDEFFGGGYAMSVCHPASAIAPVCPVYVYIQTQGASLQQNNLQLANNAAFPNIGCESPPAGKSAVNTFADQFLKSTSPFGVDDSVHLHGVGTSGETGWIVDFINDSVVPGTSDGDVRYLIKRGAPHYVAWVQSVVSNCNYAATPDDSYDGLFFDNSFATYTANYTFLTDLNIGGTVGTNDADTDLWNAANDFSQGGASCTTSPCTGAGQNQASGSFVSATATASVEYGAQWAWTADMVKLLDGVNHASGSFFPKIFNGSITNNLENIQACSSCVGQFMENFAEKSGTVNSAATLANSLDVAANFNTNTTKKYFEDNKSGSEILNSSARQLLRRVSYAVFMLTYQPSQTVYAPRLELNSATPFTDTWPEEWLVPTLPLQSMTAPGPTDCAQGSCTTGGAHDLCVVGTYPACVWRREFQACYLGTLGGAAGTSIGPCAAIVNRSGLTVTLANATEKLVGTYTHLISMCVPSGGSYAAPTCSGTTYGDMGSSSAGGLDGTAWGTGPGQIDAGAEFFTYISGTTTLADGDAAILR